MKMNKKGDEMVSYILATAFFISLSVMIILWAKSHTEETTSSTIKYMEGREECKMVFIDAKATSGCTSVDIENKGTLTIKQFIVRVNTTDELLPCTEVICPAAYEELKPQPEPKTIDLSMFSDTNSVELLPIIEISKGQLASCTTKRLIVQCA